MTIRFNAGQNYATRSICNHDCIFDFTIIRRTAKSVWIKDDHTGNVVRKGIYIYNDVEQFSPHGSYSMSATISADDKSADELRG